MVDPTKFPFRIFTVIGSVEQTSKETLRGFVLAGKQIARELGCEPYRIKAFLEGDQDELIGCSFSFANRMDYLRFNYAYQGDTVVPGRYVYKRVFNSGRSLTQWGLTAARIFEMQDLPVLIERTDRELCASFDRFSLFAYLDHLGATGEVARLANPLAGQPFKPNPSYPQFIQHLTQRKDPLNP